MKKGIAFFLIFIIIVVLAFAGCGSSREQSAASNQFQNNGVLYQKNAVDDEQDYMTCTNCGGKGMEECTWCDGTGYMEMMGEVIACYTCSGKGYKTCFRCSGEGVISNPNKTSDSGNGMVINPYIGYDNNNIGGYGTNCARCNGTGLMTCPTCHGTGSIGKTVYAPDYIGGGGGMDIQNKTCTMCHGQRQIQCSLCFGKGTVG